MKTSRYSAILLSVFLSLSTTVFAQKHLTILHTNDTHSRIEPLPANDKYGPNKGGAVRRANFIQQMRQQDKNVLLFDAGDFLQGTPYFNLFKGKVEVSLMNKMDYDAATLGNHEFDYGLETLAEIVDNAEFPIIASNYDFSGTILENKIKPYIILKRNGLRIGVLATCVQPKGLIAVPNYEGMRFSDPIETANRVALQLKKQHKCDMIICISHLGYTDDKVLAAKSRNIDLIIGGHSHTFMQSPDLLKNLDNRDVLIYQTPGKGQYVGKIDVSLNKTN